MGQCYSVTATFKAKDEARLCDLTNEYIKGERFAEGCFSRSDLSTAKGCVKAILAGDNQPSVWSETDNGGGWLVCGNAFEATYSWEAVLCDWFCAIAPALEDGSRLYTTPDDADWELIVKDGAAVENTIPTYLIDELKTPECEEYALDEAVSNLWLDQSNGEGWDDERLVSYARKNGIRFYADGRIAIN